MGEGGGSWAGAKHVGEGEVGGGWGGKERGGGAGLGTTVKKTRGGGIHWALAPIARSADCMFRPVMQMQHVCEQRWMLPCMLEGTCQSLHPIPLHD